MKKVVKEMPVDVVLVENVRGDKYYGLISHFGGKGFITRSSYGSGNYEPRCAKNLTIADKFCFRHDSIGGLIDDLLKNLFKVFEFDTPEELFAWLAE